MTVKTGPDDFSFAADGMTGTACAAALNRVRSLALSAPPGRAFAAIATLTELSGKIENRLDASSEAVDRSDRASAELEWARAVVLMDKMANEARGNQPKREAEPAFLRRKFQSDF